MRLTTKLTSLRETILTFATRSSARSFFTISRNPNSSAYVFYSSFLCRDAHSSQSSRSFAPYSFQRNPGFAASKCLSSISSSAASSPEWSDAVSYSESGCGVGEGVVGSEEEDDEVNEASGASISVRAFFFSTSVDLRRLTEQNKRNFIPPSSRMTNYVVLRFGDLRLDPNVDGMVGEFTDINREMEKTGTFTMERKKLFQLVGKANSNLADVILKLGLFERSDIAWKDAKYAQIWEYLRDEFELTQRFASLDFKLKFVEHNIRFLQEILQNRKSDFLEWLIIILIGAEILISVYDIAHKSAITSL
ncbi:UNVERIFIED_CONTAM: Sporulation protein RMD1 [Sesamum latifolium]|uniref:Sporulation protein RMD1 n=1 Tax=Sesamum latifolium TaxID=2727402 RepID=A0AAW2XEH3_9LAMI